MNTNTIRLYKFGRSWWARWENDYPIETAFFTTMTFEQVRSNLIPLNKGWIIKLGE